MSDATSLPKQPEQEQLSTTSVTPPQGRRDYQLIEYIKTFRAFTRLLGKLKIKGTYTDNSGYIAFVKLNNPDADLSAYRDFTYGWSLKDSKDFVESFRRKIAK